MTIMKTIPEELVDAIDSLVNSADDDGCEGLVVVDKDCFLNLVGICGDLGLSRIITHIEEEI
jgi:hypothetical protein